MSYFHKNPPADELRNFVLDRLKAEFDHFTLHDVKTIIIPDERPIKSFPKQGSCTEAFNEYTDWLAGTDPLTCVLDFLGKVLLSIVVSITLVVISPVNLLAIFDEFIWGTKMQIRIGFVRTSYVVVNEGVFIYQTELKRFKCIDFLACLSKDLYVHQAEAIRYCQWVNNEVHRADEQEFPERYGFTNFLIGTNSFLLKDEHFQVLQESREAWVHSLDV
eukprot:augustus_masked-scaffold_12-processed-gene-12.77-mRNA-1 protein AED:1.00 eAED:1.00 QI:0/-1/0/0/-1/1/1/0/217